MTLLQTTSAVFIVGVLAATAQSAEDQTVLQGGSYEVEVRLELPNAGSSATDKTTTICIGTNDGSLPVLSDNNPLAECPARNVRRNGATLSFDIVCDGRDGAKARAVYTLMPRAFEGRIAMMMGGKNMTMTEVQTGRRVGSCDPADAPRN